MPLIYLTDLTAMNLNSLLNKLRHRIEFIRPFNKIFPLGRYADYTTSTSECDETVFLEEVDIKLRKFFINLEFMRNGMHIQASCPRIFPVFIVEGLQYLLSDLPIVHILHPKNPLSVKLFRNEVISP